MNDDESSLPANRLLQPTTAKWFGVALIPLIVRRKLMYERGKREAEAS